MKSMKMVVGFCVLCFAIQVFAQGSLTPPGAPGSVMKTLSQIEPRTAITNLPLVITKPGSYYLTSNLVPSGTGITIETNDVTIDLMGYTIEGTSGHDSLWLHGATNNMLFNVVVCNGTIRGGYYGIDAYYVTGCRFEKLTIYKSSL